MKNLFRFTLLFVLLCSLSACGSPQEEINPAAVIEEMEARWNAKDLDGVLALVADDIVETNGRGLFYGKDSLMDIYEAAIEAFSLDCGNYLVAGKEVYYDCFQDFYDSDRVQVEQYQSIVDNGRIKANILVKQFVPPADFKIDSTLP